MRIVSEQGINRLHLANSAGKQAGLSTGPRSLWHAHLARDYMGGTRGDLKQSLQRFFNGTHPNRPQSQHAFQPSRV